MRRLTPMFLTASILAFAAGDALAMGHFKKDQKAPDTTSSSMTPSPTVPANSQNPQGMSYSDKSSSAPGTNARMDSNSTPGAATTSSSPSTTALTEEDKHALASTDTARADRTTVAANAPSTTTSSTDAMGTEKPAVKHKAKKAKKKVAKNDNVSGNPPTPSTSPAAAKSTTGTSPGGDSR